MMQYEKSDKNGKIIEIYPDVRSLSELHNSRTGESSEISATQ